MKLTLYIACYPGYVVYGIIDRGMKLSTFSPLWLTRSLHNGLIPEVMMTVKSKEEMSPVNWAVEKDIGEFRRPSLTAATENELIFVHYYLLTGAERGRDSGLSR